jgi:hypothetical protein
MYQQKCPIYRNSKAVRDIVLLLMDCCSWEEERDTAINITMECLTVMEWPGELVVSYVCDFGLN